MAKQMGDGGLTVGASDTDQFQLPLGMSVPDGSNACQCGTGILALPYADIFRQRLFRRILYQDGGSPQLQRLCNILMTVTAEALDGNKQTAVPCLPGVIAYACNFQICRPGQVFCLQTGQ